MGKIIVFTNVKGGVGKTLMCSYFASYLTQKGRRVAVVDADIQQSLSDHREDDLQKYPNLPIPWQIKSFAGMTPEAVANTLSNQKNLSYDVIIDCPGNIIDPNLKAIYSIADIAVVPIHYDPDSMRGTMRFVRLFKKNFRARMFFLPNNISGIEENRDSVKELRDKTFAILKDFGYLTARVKRCITIADYSTILPLTYFQKNAVKYPFQPIIEELEKGGVE